MDIIVAISHGAVAPGIGDAGNGGGVADSGLVVDIVGAPEGRELAEQIGLLVRMLGRAEPIDRIRARILADRLQAVADLVNGVVPTHPLPRTTFELHWIFQATLTNGVLAHAGAFCAIGAKIEGAVETRFLAGPDTVLDFRHDRAAHRAMGTDRLDGHCLAGPIASCGLGLADARQWQATAKRCDAARRNTGRLEKIAAPDCGRDRPIDRLAKIAASRSGRFTLTEHDAFPDPESPAP